MATSLSRLMKKAASSVIPLAKRTYAHRRSYTSAINTINNTTNPSIQASRDPIFTSNHHNSSIANKKSNSDVDTLLSLIMSEISSAEEKYPKVAEAPKKFPFKIVDDERWDSIRLLRYEYQGDEKIEVSVYRFKPSDSHVELSVRVSKKSVPIRKIDVRAEATEGITIHCTEPSVCGYKTIPFSDLDESSQKALHTYLEVRGIGPCIGKFLYEYMVHKKHKKHTEWLKDLKDFIAE